MPPKESQGQLSALHGCDAGPWQLPAYGMALSFHRSVAPSLSDDARVVVHEVHTALSQSRPWEEPGIKG